MQYSIVTSLSLLGLFFNSVASFCKSSFDFSSSFLGESLQIIDNSPVEGTILMLALILMIPMLFVLGYLYYVLIAFVLMFLVIILVRIMVLIIGFHLSIRDSICIGLYASIFLAINLAIKPIIFLYYSLLFVYLIYSIIASILVGEFSESKKHHSRMTKNRKF